eukprot:scaffold2610_cov115-Isochrysis_galbana.AAC.2
MPRLCRVSSRRRYAGRRVVGASCRLIVGRTIGCRRARGQCYTMAAQLATYNLPAYAPRTTPGVTRADGAVGIAPVGTTPYPLSRRLPRLHASSRTCEEDGPRDEASPSFPNFPASERLFTRTRNKRFTPAPASARGACRRKGAEEQARGLTRGHTSPCPLPSTVPEPKRHTAPLYIRPRSLRAGGVLKVSPTGIDGIAEEPVVPIGVVPNRDVLATAAALHATGVTGRTHRLSGRRGGGS